MGAACPPEDWNLDISADCEMVIDRRIEWLGCRECGVLGECE